MTSRFAAHTARAIPDDPSDLSLPVDEWRQYQREKMEEVYGLFADHKVIFMPAPTGSGKTIMGVGLGHTLGRTIYLTETINLQQQYLQTAAKAVTATGRRNHTCPATKTVRGATITADDAPCPCPIAASDSPCGYYAQWINAEDAADVVLNYAFAARVLRARALRLSADEVIDNPFHRRSLMVCDEGHLIERALLGAASVEFYRRPLERLGLTLPDTRSLDEWRKWGQTSHDKLAPLAGEQARKFSERVRSSEPIAADELKNVRRWKNAIESLDRISGLPADTIIARTPEGYKFQPLWVWGRANKMLFDHAPNVLIMSATMGAPWLLARLLGFQEGDWATVEVPSTFDVRNRPVYYWPLAKMNARAAGSEMDKQIGALNYFAQLGRFGAGKGVVHCASYRLAQWIYTHEDLDEKVRNRMIVHDAAHRDEAFREFEEADEDDPVILVSPAAWTGVDWPYRIDWQFVPKVPFADLTDPLVRARFEYVDEEGEKIGRIVYTHEAANTLIQGVGRGVRAKDDRCVTLITDSNFGLLFNHTARDAFPQWFREAVKKFDGPNVTKGAPMN